MPSPNQAPPPPLRDPGLSLIAILVAVAFLPAIASRGPWAPDEPRYLEVAREMRLGGDWLLPRLNGHVYGEKPPLYFALVAALSAVTADYAIAGRLVSLGAVVATLGALFAFARRKCAHGNDVGVVAMAILGTMLLFVATGQQGVIDPLLTACTTVATVALIIAADGPPGARARAIAVALAATALGGLAKGPAGIVTPGLAALAATWAAGGRRAVPIGAILGSVAFGAAVTLGWLYIAAGRAGPEGEAYWNRMLLEQTLGRVEESWSHRKPAWFYVAHTPWGLLPWTAFLPAAALEAWRRRSDPADPGRPGALAWAAATLMFYSAVSGKRPGYVLPLFPALAVVIAAHIEALDRREIAPGRLDRLAGYACGAALVALAVAIAAAPFVFGLGLVDLSPLDDSAREVQAAVPPAAYILGPAVGLVVGVLGAFNFRHLREGRWSAQAAGIAASMALVSLFAHLAVAPALDPVKSFRAFGEALGRTLPPGARLVLYPYHYDGLVGFYTGAMGYEVCDDDPAEPGVAGDLGWLRAQLDQPGTLWLVNTNHTPFPPDIERRLVVRVGQRVGRRNHMLFQEVAAP